MTATEGPHARMRAQVLGAEADDGRDDGCGEDDQDRLGDFA